VKYALAYEIQGSYQKMELWKLPVHHAALIIPVVETKFVNTLNVFFQLSSMSFFHNCLIKKCLKYRSYTVVKSVSYGAYQISV
jgi:hypothetical protein